MDDNIDFYSHEGKELFHDLKNRFGSIKIENPDKTDIEWIKKVLGISLISDPIKNGKPFSVERKNNIKNNTAGIFRIKSFKLSAGDRMMGGFYNIRLYAVNPSEDLYYVFNGRILEYVPYIDIDDAHIGRIS